MAEFSIRSDTVDVEQIMRQIRARIREKRGVDYTEEEIRELASVKLEKFLDPGGLRSDLMEQFRRNRPEPPPPPNYGFEDHTLFESHRPLVRWIRRLLRPVLKLLFNPNPLIQVLHLQSQINAQLYARNRRREDLDPLYYEVMHNLVLELTRLGIEVKNLKMRVESISSRLDFDERRARALEDVVQYRPGARAAEPIPGGPSAALAVAENGTPVPGERRRRRRRRRRRGSGQASAAGAAETARGVEPSGTGQASLAEAESASEPDEPETVEREPDGDGGDEQDP